MTFDENIDFAAEVSCEYSKVFKKQAFVAFRMRFLG